jgi:oligoribonuclease NrnB/cAMP/cGMP phosphodiesterase (DHH superfamily)
MLICVYHKRDHDGRCSASIVKSKFPDCKLIGMDHHLPFPWRDIPKGSDVIMCDFSLPIEKLKHLATRCNFTWIDHHISIIKDANSAGFNPKGLREIGRSGCELTWAYLYPNAEMPTAVHLLGRYDVWDESIEDAYPFQYGLQTYDTSVPYNDLWKNLFDGNHTLMAEIFKRGKVVMDYHRNLFKDASNLAFEATVEGYRAIVVNITVGDSTLFRYLCNPEDYEVMVNFGIRNGEAKISIYSVHDHIDVSAIAARYGGGGHKGAAGWSMPPNKLSEAIVV